MSDDEDIAALVVDNGSGMCKGMLITCIADFDRSIIEDSFKAHRRHGDRPAIMEASDPDF